MTHEVPTGVEIDPSNGFEYVWISGPKGSVSYSLVRGSVTAPIRIVYSKVFDHDLDVRINISPSDNPNLWVVSGTLDSDSILNLCYNVAERREREKPPVLNDVNILDLEHQGIVRVNSGSRMFKSEGTQVSV